jgi:predicted RNase H-like HicB family nuclease
MFFSIYVRRDSANRYEASVPDLSGCTVVSESRNRALTDIHLAIETRVAKLLGSESTIPASRSIQELRQDDDFGDGELFEIHINLDHLRAVASHQAGRWG